MHSSVQRLNWVLPGGIGHLRAQVRWEVQGETAQLPTQAQIWSEAHVP